MMIYQLRPGRHGTHANYKRGCRCEDCRRAWNEYKKARKKAAEDAEAEEALIRAWAKPLPPPVWDETAFD